MAANERKRSLRDSLARVMSHVATEVGVAVLIAASVGLLIYEAALPPGSPQRLPIARANDVITWIFVGELTLRFLAERRKTRFFRRFWLDIIAVLPLFRALRMLRILRLLRLFRLGAILTRHGRQFFGVFGHVKLEYIFAALMVVVVVLMGALSIRFAEGRGADGFASFEEALWFAVMTIVASEPIGAEPSTPLGRMVALALMLGGMTVFAFFAGTVSAVMIDSLRKLRFRRMEIEELEGHVVVCGWNIAGELFLEELLQDESVRNVVIITEDQTVSEAELGDGTHRIHVLNEDFTRASVLRRAGVERAAFAVILPDSGGAADRSTQDRDARTVLAAMLVEKLNEHIHTTVQLLNAENEVSLREAGVEDVIISDAYVGSMMANVVKNRGMVPVISEILTSRYGQQLFKVAAPSEVHGLPASEAMSVLKERHDATLLAIEKPEGGFVVNPPVGFRIEPDHYLVVTAREPIK